MDSSLLNRLNHSEDSALSFTYRRHYGLALKAPSHSVVDALGFPPARVNAFVSVALVSIETLSVCLVGTSASILYNVFGKSLYAIAMVM